MSHKQKRSHTSMRSKVTNYLVPNFYTIEKAGEFFNIDYFSDNPSAPYECTLEETNAGNSSLELDDPSFFLSDCLGRFDSLQVEMQSKLLNSLFSKFVINLFNDKSISKKFPVDCLSTYISVVRNLHSEGKGNLIHHAARCFLRREDSPDTRLPVDKILFGLFDYIVKFFSLPKSNNLKCEKDYEEWQVSMYANFGTKWACMHRGPCWEYAVPSNSESG